MHMEISSKRKVTLQINDSKRHERIWKLFLIAQLMAYYQLISTKAVGVENLLKSDICICSKIIIKKSLKSIKKIMEHSRKLTHFSVIEMELIFPDYACFKESV